jgi:hypothetical protein
MHMLRNKIGDLAIADLGIRGKGRPKLNSCPADSIQDRYIYVTSS